MVFREVDVVEVREVLRGWLDGVGLRTVAARAGVDRNGGKHTGVCVRLVYESETKTVSGSWPITSGPFR